MIARKTFEFMCFWFLPKFVALNFNLEKLLNVTLCKKTFVHETLINSNLLIFVVTLFTLAKENNHFDASSRGGAAVVAQNPLLKRGRQSQAISVVRKLTISKAQPNNRVANYYY